MNIEGILQYKGPVTRPAHDAPASQRPTSASPASMTRRLGPTEVIYCLLDQLYCLNFVVFAEISGSLELAMLNLALHAVQREQPLLRTHIVRVKGHPCFKAAPLEQMPLLAQARPLRNWRSEITAQLDTPFKDEAPLARFFWFSNQNGKSVAAMVFHHAIADGKSGANVLMNVLRRACGEALPLKFQPAHKCAQDLDPIQDRGMIGGSIKKIGFWLDQGRAALRFPKQLPGYDMGMGTQRTIQTIAFSMSAKTSTALLSACRSHGTTVHGALGAAQLLAIHNEFDSPAPRHLALTSLADLRGVLYNQLSSSDLGLYIATITTVHKVTAAPDFWPLAVDLKAQLAQVLSSGDANLIHSFYRQNTLIPIHRHSARLIQSAAALAPPSSMLTNIGKLDTATLANGTRIRSIAFLVSPPPQHPICVTVASYANRMHLNLLYDHSKITAAQTQRMARAIQTFLQAAANESL